MGSEGCPESGSVVAVPEPDPVLSELDAEIDRLEAAARGIQGELAKVREMRSWWAERHPVIVRFDQVERADGVTVFEVLGRTQTLREFILRVLQSTNKPLTVAEIRDQALAMGWETTSDNKGPMVRNNLRRLIDEGLVEQPDKRRYVLRPSRSSDGSGDEELPANGDIQFDVRPTQPGRAG
jgi:hypothetical protein